MDIWFWQRIVTPHMAGLASALAADGHRVTYAAEEMMSAERAGQGWSVPKMPGGTVCCVESGEHAQALVAHADGESVHICQGIRANGRVGAAQEALAARGLRQWVVMETVDDAGFFGVVKRVEYTRLFRRRLRDLEGVAAIGYRTAAWLASRGVPNEMAFPFAYFLPEPPPRHEDDHPSERPFQFVFVGQLIERKRLNLLLQALSGLDTRNFKLTIVGSGPKTASLRAQADESLGPGHRPRWCGQLPMDAARDEVSRADCLVLPSRHDGWGAVVSEALLAGTPAICSDACGSAGVVHASGAGGVFPSGSAAALRGLLYEALDRGPVSPRERMRLAEWAQCLGAKRGARYLEDILAHRANGSPRPLPPWEPA